MYLAIVKPCNCSNSVEVGGVDEVGDDEDIFPLPRDVISSTATRRLSGSSGKQREGRIVFPSIIIIARTDKRTDGAARRTYSPGASIRGKVGCQRSELRSVADSPYRTVFRTVLRSPNCRRGRDDGKGRGTARLPAQCFPMSIWKKRKANLVWSIAR